MADTKAIYTSMIRNLSLNFFNVPETRKYHLYRISGSEAAQTAHSHNYYQICYVDKGEIQHWQNDIPVRLLFGDAFIVPPGFIHRIVFSEKDSYIYSLSFEEDMFHPGFSYSNVYRFMTALKLDTMYENRIDIRMKLVLNEKQRFIMKSLLDSLLLESTSDCPIEQSSSSSLIAAIMCVLSQAYFQDDQRKDSFDRITHYSRSMSECLEYIDNNYTLQITLNELTRRFALSKSTFSLLFPQFTGMTFKRYIAEKRIGQAAILAKNSMLSMNEIAKMVGYEEFSTFYRNFEKITGVSPSEFRVNALSGSND